MRLGRRLGALGNGIRFLWRSLGREWTVSQHIERIMGLSSDDRLNLTKAWDYLSEAHFEAHAQCVKNRVRYRWLAYDSPTIEDDWENYKEALKDYGVSAENIGAQIECKVLPFSKEQLPRIPYRITLFGDVISVSFEEPEAGSYHNAIESVTISQAVPSQAGVYRDLKIALEVLYSGCNDIATYKTLPQNPRIADHAHLRTTFLKALACQDLRLKYEEATAFVGAGALALAIISFLVALSTMIMVWVFRPQPHG